MSTRQLKVANLLIWGGILLSLIGLIVAIPNFYPYLATQAREIPTAPPLETTYLAEDSSAEEGILLPFEEEEAAYSRLDAPLQRNPDTPTPSTPEVTPTPFPSFRGTPPVRILIPDINLDAPVIPIEWERDETGAAMWMVPDWRAAGWHYTSAPLGLPGNTVLNGHNTTRGEVFRDLYRLEPGARLTIWGEDDAAYLYTVEEMYILPEAGQPIEVRLENARYIQATTDERLTLVTCHPYGSTRNRLIVIARPSEMAVLPD